LASESRRDLGRRWCRFRDGDRRAARAALIALAQIVEQPKLPLLSRAAGDFCGFWTHTITVLRAVPRVIRTSRNLGP
jgi:hypothetical protein